MKVNKKIAAQLVGVGRTTFYRHIDEKKISVHADGKIDVSELIRVYGNENVKTPEQVEATLAKKSLNHGTHALGTLPDNKLTEEIVQLRREIENLDLERRRERDQYSSEIEHLRNRLEQSMNQNNILTKLISDKRSDEEKAAHQTQSTQDAKLEEVLKAVKHLEERQTKKAWPFWKRA